MTNKNTLPNVGRTVLDKLLLDYAGTLEIEYLGRRCAKIRFMYSCRKHELERKFIKSVDGYMFDCLHDFNCNGIWTTATIRLHPTSKPFYELKDIDNATNNE